MPEAAAPAVTIGQRHFLTFRLDDRHYALPAETVVEVIRIPPVARIPQSPPGLLGLANLRGTILPVASGRELLGQTAAKDTFGEARAVVLAGTSPVALTVDAVLELIELASTQIEVRESEIAALPGEMLQGAFKAVAGDRIVKLLDIQGLLRKAFVVHEQTKRSVKAQGADRQSLSAGDGRIHAKMVGFAVADQEYALPLETVQEIAAAPPMLAAVPHSEALVLGVAAFRDSLLPILSLRGLLGLPRASDHPGEEKVIVTHVNGKMVGLVVDSMRAIFAADEARMDPVPEVLAARIGGESRVKAIYRGDHGLVSILSTDQLFGENVMQKLSDARPASQPSMTSPDKIAQSQQFLVFRLGDEEFGLPIACVEEVARVPESVARVPKTPKFLEGVVNLRGEVLPVIDQRKRFNMPPAKLDIARRLIVVRSEHHVAGMIVDSVSEVLRTPVDAIDTTPDLTGESTKLVRGVVNLEDQNRIVLLLDPAELLTRTERGLLDTFGKLTVGTESSRA